MSEVVQYRRGELTDFNPEATRERVSVLEQAIRHAKNMEAWESGWEAVDFLIREQKDFVAWWDANVRGPGGDQKSLAPIRANDRISRDLAEEKTDISHQRVSKWRKRLGDTASESQDPRVTLQAAGQRSGRNFESTGRAESKQGILRTIGAATRR